MGGIIAAGKPIEAVSGDDRVHVPPHLMHGRNGDHYVLNGAKTFISNGMTCDLVIVAARTENSDDPHRSLSLFVVEGDTTGFIRSRKLEKMGMESQDTAELAFDDCRVPAGNLLGQEGMGFMMLMQQLQQERHVEEDQLDNL